MTEPHSTTGNMMDHAGKYPMSVDRIYSPDNENQKGFTLVELMFVVAIIGILAASTIPRYVDYRKRAMVTEALTVSRDICRAVGDFYAYRGNFPQDNAALGLQPKDQLPGQYAESIEVQNGAVHIQFYKKIMDEEEPIITLRPAAVESYPQGNTVAWVCGYAAPAEGMIAYGENRTSIRKEYLPRVCW